MDTPHDHSPTGIADQPVMPTQAELEAAIDADDVHVAAGRVVPLQPVLTRMRDAAEHIRQECEAKATTQLTA